VIAFYHYGPKGMKLSHAYQFIMYKKKARRTESANKKESAFLDAMLYAPRREGILKLLNPLSIET